MWDAIRENRRRSWLLIGLMGMILLAVGALTGRLLIGPDGAVFGVLGAGAIWCTLTAITHWGGERLILFSAGAREISKDDAPRLWNIVEEMTLAAGLGRMPRVYVLDSYLQNAFATGRSPETARVVVTEGLIRRLSRDELQGVVAHELGHIKNQDVRFMTIATVMLGSVTLVSDSLRRLLWFGGGRRHRLKGGPYVQVALLGAALLVAVLAPLFTRLLYLACSRRREFLADASAARFTRYPEGLASALEKIAEKVGVTDDPALRALAPMYVVNPMRTPRGGLFRTHPPTEQRVRILRSMGGAGWVDYEKAYRRVVGTRRRCLNPKTVASERSVSLRAAAAGSEAANEAVERIHEVGALLDRWVNVVLIPCPCGLRIKVPPEFRRPVIQCPRCSRSHKLPVAGPVSDSNAASNALMVSEPSELQYQKKTPGWDSFRCRCGRVLHLSPRFRVPRIKCASCGEKIRILQS